MNRKTLWFLLTVAASLVFLTAAAGATTPGASFTANMTNGSAPLAVQFIDTSTYTPTSWTWSFGDGGTSSVESPVHVYANPGTFTVTLTATNADGSNTATETGYIVVTKVAAMPVAGFVSSVTSGSEPLAVQFVDSSTNSPASWAWSFGDGGTSTTENPSHTFTTTGTFTVTLTATNSAGSNTISKAAYIVVSPAAATPVANFAATKTAGTTPFAVQFIDTSTNSPTSWAWSFGDGYTSLQQNPLHTYSSVGTFTVTLTASNSAGSSTFTQSGYITTTLAPPIASFTSNVTSGTVPLYVQFNDTSLNSPGSWNWLFGDGNSSNVQNPVYEYTSPGNFTVVLTATNTAGFNSSAITQDINVSAVTTPVVSFMSDTTSGIVPLTVRFTDTSTNHPTSWQWNFGDGVISTAQDPVHVYTRAGNFTVILVAANSGGSGTVTSSNYVDAMVVTPVTTIPTIVPFTVMTTQPVTMSMTTPSPAEQVPVTTATTAAPAGSSGGSSGLLPGVLVLLVVIGVIAIIAILRRRPPQGPHRSHGREL
jgi:PKD repeat protein